jgi:hypothetical protein
MKLWAITMLATCTSQNNIKLELKETGSEATEQINLAQESIQQYALQATAMNLCVLKHKGDFLTT